MDLAPSLAEVQQQHVTATLAHSDTWQGHATSSGSSSLHAQPASAPPSIGRSLRQSLHGERWSSVTPPDGHTVIRRLDGRRVEFEGSLLPIPSPDLNIALWSIGVVPIWRQQRSWALCIGIVASPTYTAACIARIVLSLQQHASEADISRALHGVRISVGTLGILVLGYVASVVNRNEVVIRPVYEQHALRHQVRALLLVMSLALITDSWLKWSSYGFVNVGCNIGVFGSRAAVVLLLLENVEQHLEQLNRFINDVNRGMLQSLDGITRRYDLLHSSVGSTDCRWRWWLLLYTLFDATAVICTVWMLVQEFPLDLREVFYANINLTFLYGCFVATHFWAVASLNDEFENAPSQLQLREGSQGAIHTAFFLLSTRKCKIRVAGITALSRVTLRRVLFSIAGTPLLGYLFTLFLRSAHGQPSHDLVHCAAEVKLFI